MADFRLTGGTLRLPSGAVTNESVAASTMVDADKLEHIHKAATDFGLDRDDTPVAADKVVFVAEKVGVIRGFHCLLIDTGTAADVDFDLKVNGSTVLSGVVNITDADTDGDVQDGTISAAALAIGDIVSIDLAITTSTGALGPYAWVDIDEPAP